MAWKNLNNHQSPGTGDSFSVDIPFCISSTMAKNTHQQNKWPPKLFHLLTIRSQCFLAASNPSLNSLLNSRKCSLLTPPSTSTYSSGNLKGAASNPRFPGEFDNMNPKSIWTRCPSRSNRMFPLCLSLICSR
jgi:hypothetical protein